MTRAVRACEPSGFADGPRNGYNGLMDNQTNRSAVERADALLTRWGSRPVLPGPNAEGGTKAGGGGKTGRGVVKTLAFGYVALASRTGSLVDPLVKTWREGVAEAQRRQEQQTGRSPGQEQADENEGGQALKESAGAAASAAGTAV